MHGSVQKSKIVQNPFLTSLLYEVYIQIHGDLVQGPLKQCKQAYIDGVF